MALDSTEVRLAPTGHVYVAPTGTTLPTNATMALNGSFQELGYLDEDGCSLTPGVELTDIMMWQSAVPVKTTLDTVNFEIQFNMGQVNQYTWGLYFFVGSWTNNFGQAKLTVPSSPGSQEKSLIVEWTDDLLDVCRLVIPTAVLTDRESLQLVRNNAQITGVTFRALDSSGTLAYVYSDNPDLVPSS
jgi:hypothetical protein